MPHEVQGHAGPKSKRVSYPVFMRPFFLFALFAGHPFCPLFLGTFLPLSPLEKYSVEQRPKFGKEIPSRNLRKKRSVPWSEEPVWSQERARRLRVSVLRRGIGVGVDGVTGSDAIVAQ